MTRLLVALVAFVTLLQQPTAWADEDPVRPADDAFDAILQDSSGGHAVKGNSDSGVHNTSGSAPRYEYRTDCGAGLDGGGSCSAFRCPPGEQIYRLWQVSPPPATPMGLVCSGNGPPSVAAAAPPHVTEG